MGFFDFLKGPDINQGIAEWNATPGAVLLDVLPLQSLGGGASVPAGKDAPLFVYCHSGARSRQAVSLLGQMGYAHAKNIGGIAAYQGKVER